MNKLVRRLIYTAAVAILCFAPGAFAQRQSSATIAVTLTRPGVAVMFPFKEDRKKKKRVTAPEGGAAALYLALAGACCFGAMFVQSRRQRAENAL